MTHPLVHPGKRSSFATGVGEERGEGGGERKKRAVTTASLAARINGGREGRNCKLVPLASEIIRAARHRGNRRERWKNSISRDCLQVETFVAQSRSISFDRLARFANGRDECGVNDEFLGIGSSLAQKIIQDLHPSETYRQFL